MTSIREMILPADDEGEALDVLARVLARGESVQLVCEGETVELPPSAAAALQRATKELVQGRGVSVSGLPQLVPIIIVPGLLGMQRSRLDEIISAGEIETVDKDGRELVVLQSLIAYDQRRSERQRDALRELNRLSAEHHGR